MSPLGFILFYRATDLTDSEAAKRSSLAARSGESEAAVQR